ncbi:MAG: radical SAM protein [Candidatus Eisenbacteria bacterium]
MSKVFHDLMESWHFPYVPAKLRKRASLSVAVVFPSDYAVGMDNLGLQGIFRLFASDSDVRCERAFYDQNNLGVSLEGRQPLRSFDVVAFSISFENDFLNVLRLLKAGGIEPLASKRGDGAPLVLAGGIAAFTNPEPITLFMDAIFVGEADEAVREIIDICGRRERHGRESLLESLASVSGMYVPSLHSPFLRTTGGPPTAAVRRRVVRELSSTFCSTSVSNPGSHLRGMFLVEAARGCPRQCRFCAVTSVYSPLRFVPGSSILGRVQSELGASDTVGLVGACVSSHPELIDVVRALVTKKLRVSLSSLRADMRETEVLGLIAASGTRTITIAPEVGSARMRVLINKELDEESLIQTVVSAARGGIAALRLYFMIGLPNEAQEDVEAIASLTARIQSAFTGGRKGGAVTVSVSQFVPKAFTSFQWCGMEERPSLRRKSDILKKSISGLRGVRLSVQSLRVSVLEAALSRGNWRTGLALHSAVFEGKSLKAAWRSAGLDMESEAHAGRDPENPLPWEHLCTGRGRRSLREDFNSALGKR